MTVEEYELHREEYNGYCTNCKEVTNFGGVEPDARDYPCEVCGQNTVYGVEEALLMGSLTITEGES